MDFYKQTGKNIASLLLVLALLLPTAIQFAHAFEGHQHVTCTDNTTHLHQSITKCEICSFHLSSFNYDIVNYPNLSLPEIHVKKDANLTALKPHGFITTNTQLRAPPIFS